MTLQHLIWLTSYISGIFFSMVILFTIAKLNPGTFFDRTFGDGFFVLPLSLFFPVTLPFILLIWIILVGIGKVIETAERIAQKVANKIR